MYWPRIAGVSAIAALIGCGTHRYAEYGSTVGFSELLAWGVVREGEPIKLALVERSTGRRRPGLRVGFTDPKSSPLTSDASGVVAFPISRKMLDQNPKVHAEHAGDIYFRFVSELRCEQFEGVVADRKVRFVEAQEYLAWPHRDRDVDVVYAEPNVPVRILERAAGELVALRAMMRDVTGVEPPPIAAAIMVDDGTARMAPGPGGRPVIGVRMDTADLLLAGPFVHAWMHRLLRVRVIAPENGTRFLEEGLVDFTAHRVRERLRRVSGSTMLDEHLRVLNAKKATVPYDASTRVDVLAMPADIDARSLPNLARAIHAQCNKNAELGAALGFAIAYERGANDEGWIARTVNALTSPDVATWNVAFDKRSFDTTSATNTTVDGAIRVLQKP